MSVSREVALIGLRDALKVASDTGVLDLVGAECGPDMVNSFCDVVQFLSDEALVETDSEHSEDELDEVMGARCRAVQARNDFIVDQRENVLPRYFSPAEIDKQLAIVLRQYDRDNPLPGSPALVDQTL